MHPSIARRLTGIAIALAIALAACSFNNGYVLDVSVDGGDRTIALGEPLTLTATVANGNGASDRVTWTSSDLSVATIGGEGRVTSTTYGPTEITAASTSDPSRSDTITLVVDRLATLRWTRQFGTGTADEATGVATDASGNVFVAGTTFGSLEGTGEGGLESFLRAYDAAGDPRWTRQFGSALESVSVSSVATDTNGVVYVAGGAVIAGGTETFLRAYDPDGNERWTRQLGSSGSDLVYGVATDPDGNVYLTGATTGDLGGPNAGEFDAFLLAYDADGTLRWSRQFGSSQSDFAYGVATDADGNVYLAGNTSGDLDGPSAGATDAFLRVYDPDGNLRWARQFGTSTSDEAVGVATDASGNVYVAGATDGALEGTSAGEDDAFLRAYDTDGNPRWTRQFGSSAYDYLQAVATDANGNVFVAGATDGDLAGTSAGEQDAFLRAYDTDGNPLGTRQFGTDASDVVRSIATDGNGNVYVTGRTDGDLAGPNAGGDAFLRAYGR